MLPQFLFKVGHIKKLQKAIRDIQNGKMPRRLLHATCDVTSVSQPTNSTCTMSYQTAPSKAWPNTETDHAPTKGAWPNSETDHALNPSERSPTIRLSPKTCSSPMSDAEEDLIPSREESFG